MTDAAYTTSIEDYLKAIYDLSSSGGRATASDVAARLGVARPSVSAMSVRLAEKGLVTHHRQLGLELTKAGRRVALQLVRRHRLVEAYLVAALGYSWDEVHAEAERLEHTVSDEMVNRMARAIGEPEVDPHGAPIPTTRGTVAESSDRTLDDLSAGEETRVVRVEDEDPEFLRYLSSLSLTPGTVVRVVGRDPFGGPLAIRVGSRTHRVGPALAARVFVA